jgi:preprotein translocase subunit SecD
MHKIKWLPQFLLIILLGLSLACVTLTNGFVPAIEIFVSPQESSDANAKNLEQANQIIQARLKENLKGRYSVKVLDNRQISVTLSNANDLETAKRLATEPGAITFVDSTKSYEAGSKLGNAGKIILTQQDMKAATVIPDQFESYQIDFVLTPDGTQKMMAYTSNNVGHYLVIVRDGTVITSPMVNSAITDGQGVIAGKYSLQEAHELVSLLLSQPLPIQLVVAEVKSP